MITSQHMAMGVAMKLASDGKESNPAGLLVILAFMAIVSIINWLGGIWMRRRRSDEEH